MHDFTLALARLLRDGELRERFAQNPTGALDDLRIEGGDRMAILRLDPEELEMQATVLLHKRFEEVRRVLSSTCANLGESAWPLFRKYARYYWPDGETDVWADADAFGGHLVSERSDSLDRAEKNRVAFAVGTRRFGVAFVRRLTVGINSRPAFQIFWRSRKRGWREMAIYLSL